METIARIILSPMHMVQWQASTPDASKHYSLFRTFRGICEGYICSPLIFTLFFITFYRQLQCGACISQKSRKTLAFILSCVRPYTLVLISCRCTIVHPSKLTRKPGFPPFRTLSRFILSPGVDANWDGLKLQVSMCRYSRSLIRIANVLCGI